MGLKSVLTTVFCELAGLAHFKPKPGLRILLYHALGTELDCGVEGLSIAPERFRDQMKLLKETPAFKMTGLRIPDFPGDASYVAVTFDDGYRDNLEAAAPILSELEIPFTVFVVPAYVRGGKPPYLDLSGLRELARAPGCRIGSHGMNHRALAALPDGELRRELRDSRLWLEDALGLAVREVSYPYGSASRRVRDAAAAAGYALGLCSRTGVNGAERDPLVLCRTEILASDDPRRFRQKLHGAWDWHRFRHPDPLKR